MKTMNLSTGTTTQRRAGWVGVAVLAGLLLAACGGGGDDSLDTASVTTTDASAKSQPDADGTDDADGAAATTVLKSDDFCRVVTKAEAEAVTRKTFDAGTGTSSDGPLGGIGSCVYKIIEGGRVTTIVNIVVVGTKVPRDVYDKEIAGDAPDAKAVSGAGESALLIQPGLLSVFDDGVALSVQVLINSAPGSTDDLVALAKKALDRL